MSTSRSEASVVSEKETLENEIVKSERPAAEKAVETLSVGSDDSSETKFASEQIEQVRQVLEKNRGAIRAVVERSEELGIKIDPENLGNIVAEQKELEERLRELERRRKFVSGRDGEGRLTAQLDEQAEKLVKRHEALKKITQADDFQEAVRAEAEAEGIEKVHAEWTDAAEVARERNLKEFLFNGQRYVSVGDKYVLRPDNSNVEGIEDLSDIEIEDLSDTEIVGRKEKSENKTRKPRWEDAAAVARERNLKEFLFNGQRYVLLDDKYVLHPDNSDVEGIEDLSDIEVAVEEGSEESEMPLSPEESLSETSEEVSEPDEKVPEEFHEEAFGELSGETSEAAGADNEPPRNKEVSPEQLRLLLDEARERYAAALLAKLEGRRSKNDIDEAREAWRQLHTEYRKWVLPDVTDIKAHQSFLLGEYDKLTETMIKMRADRLRIEGADENERFSVRDITELKRYLIDAVEGVADEIIVGDETGGKVVVEEFVGEKPRIQEEARERVLAWLEEQTDLTEKMLDKIEISNSKLRDVLELFKKGVALEFLYPKSAKRVKVSPSEEVLAQLGIAKEKVQTAQPWGFDLPPEYLKHPDSDFAAVTAGESLSGKKLALTAGQFESLRKYIEQTLEKFKQADVLKFAREKSLADFVRTAQELEQGLKPSILSEMPEKRSDEKEEASEEREASETEMKTEGVSASEVEPQTESEPTDDDGNEGVNNVVVAGEDWENEFDNTVEDLELTEEQLKLDLSKLEETLSGAAAEKWKEYFQANEKDFGGYMSYEQSKRKKVSDYIETAERLRAEAERLAA